MKVRIDRPERALEMDFEGTAAELMEELDVNPETVIVSVDGKVVTEDSEITGADEVKFVSVVSGG